MSDLDEELDELRRPLQLLIEALRDEGAAMEKAKAVAIMKALLHTSGKRQEAPFRAAEAYVNGTDPVCEICGHSPSDGGTHGLSPNGVVMLCNPITGGGPSPFTPEAPK